MSKKGKKAETEAEEPYILDPDPNNLIEEWSLQPKLYREWSRKLAKARQVLRRRKAKLKLTIAELDRLIRKDPSKYRLEKLSEPAIANAVLREIDYQTAEKRMHQAEYIVDLLEGSARRRPKAAIYCVYRL